MTRNNDFRREFVETVSDRTKILAKSPRQESNHPVPVDEFDRERMGIAAKE